MMENRIDVVLMEQATDYIRSLPEKARKKVVYNINRVSNGEKNDELFKKLGDTGIWEFRTIFNGICYRLLAFWDTQRRSLIIATHGFIKKSQKTPLQEIQQAIKLREEYYHRLDKK